MEMLDDFYRVLGVDKNADIDTIKKAYRQLARQYHPDRNPGDVEAENKFKKVQEAYDTLGDPEKRALYDRRGSHSHFNSFQTNNFQDVFDMFFSQRPRQQGWGQNIEMEVVIDFIESAKGCSRTVNIDRREVCRSCNGTTARGGKEYKECVLCDGRGRVIHSQAFMRMETTCQSCQGTGKVISEFCTDCNARGHHIQPCTLELKIPAGINNGMKICARGAGDIGISGSGNLYCVVRVKPHPIFQREGIDLTVKMPITYTQAVLGGEISVPALNGTSKLKLPPGTKSGAIFRIPRQGFALPDGDDTVGDLLVKVIIDVPNDITPEYKELLEKVRELEKDCPGESHKNFKRNLEECDKL